MAVSLKHSYQSGVADEGNATLVQPTDWNAEHTLTLATDKLLGRVTAGTGAVEEVTFTDFAQTLLDDADAGTARTTLGAIGGSTGGTDNAILRADGTGGATVQSSDWTISDATGNVTAPATSNLGWATNGWIKIGAASALAIGSTSTGVPRIYNDLYIEAPAAGGLGFTGRSFITSPADGVVFIQNNAGNDFGRLQFGGTTSSFPSLKRSSAKIIVRLADDSANANLEVADEAYNATTWNGNNDVPTKNAIRDKIETMSAGSGTSLGLVVAIGQIGCVLP